MLTNRNPLSNILRKLIFPDRMLGTIPKSFSNDTLDLSSVDSMSLDEHIEIKIPESRAQENRLMAENNFIQHINEKSRNSSHSHLSVENGQELLQKLHNHVERSAEKEGREGREGKEGQHMHRSHSHASVRKHALMTNGLSHAVNGHEHKDEHHSRIKK